MEIEDEDWNINNIKEKDCWKVASAYFKQYGLVSHQIHSFNNFIKKKIQEIIDDNNLIIIKPEIKYDRNVEEQESKSYELEFGKATIEECPHFLENNNKNHILFPHEARIRNIDYSSNLFINMIWREKNNSNIIKEEKISNIYIGKIPIMVRSDYCSLNYDIHENKERDYKQLKDCECEYDQGGYFIIFCF